MRNCYSARATMWAKKLEAASRKRVRTVSEVARVLHTKPGNFQTISPGFYILPNQENNKI